MSGIDDPRHLVGTWRVERTVEDRRTGERHEIDGELVVAGSGGALTRSLTWEESLVWHRPGGDVAVRRGLRLVRESDGWWVRFEDGRDFHPWRPGERVVHPCEPDTYAGLVRGTPERWTVTWEARGPEKDYTMTSTMTARTEVSRR